MIILMPKYEGMVANRTYGDIDAFVRIITSAGYDPVAVGAIVELESAKSWSPSKRGPSGAFSMAPGYPVGLIQFAPDTAKKLGTSTADLEKMTFLQQTAYIPRYYTQFFGGPSRFLRPGDYYAAGWGNGVGAFDGFVLAKKGSDAYTKNAGLDSNNDGEITVGDLSGMVTNKVNQASRAGFWQFDTGTVNIAAMKAGYGAAGTIQQMEILLTLKWSKL